MALAGETIKAEDGALTDAWTAYTPSWTASSGTPSKGNGTLSGSYIQIGKTVFFNMVLVWGSTTSGGTSGNRWIFSLPVAAAENFAAACSIRDNSAPTNESASADCRTGAASTAIFAISSASGDPVGQGTPWSWANGDTLKITGIYQAA